VNPKGHASCSSGNANELVRKVNTVISFRSGREIDNQVRSPNEPCRYPQQFFENSSSSLPPETGSSSEPEDATDGILNDSDTPPSLESPSKKDESKEKDSSNSVDTSPPKDPSSSSPSSTEKVHMPLPPFSFTSFFP